MQGVEDFLRLDMAAAGGCGGDGGAGVADYAEDTGGIWLLLVLAEDVSLSDFEGGLLWWIGADGGGCGDRGVVSSVREGGRKPADGAGPGPVVQWRLPLTGNVSSRPGRHGRASQIAAAFKLGKDKQERKLHVNIVCIH